MEMCNFTGCSNKVYAKKLCSGHWSQQYRGKPLAPFLKTLSLKERIESKLINGPDGCLIWTGHVDTAGYPNIKYKNINYLVHRSYYKIIVRDIQKHETLDHTCRNKLCVNPDHLEPVSLSENVKRMQVAQYYEKEIDRLQKFLYSIGYNPKTLLKIEGDENAGVPS